MVRSHTSKSVSQGVGARVCAEDRTGYAYSDQVTVDRMRIAAEAARAIADNAYARGLPPVQVGTAVLSAITSTSSRSTPLEIPVEERAKLLYEIDKIARALRSAHQECDGVVHRPSRSW